MSPGKLPHHSTAPQSNISAGIQGQMVGWLFRYG
jgi:hypothetical protein